MPSLPDPPAVLWRGFRHQWRYHHPVRRIGSLVHHRSRDPQTLTTEYQIAHPTSSAGEDTVSFRDRFTELQVRGVSAIAESARFALPAIGGPFSRSFRLSLPPGGEPPGGEPPGGEPPGGEPPDGEPGAAAVLLNGFDLRMSPDGLDSLALGVTRPVLGNDRTLAFTLQGLVAGRSAPPWETLEAVLGRDPALRGASEPRPTAEGPEIAVEVLALVGSRETFHPVPGERCESSLSWDTETPIEREEVGIRTAVFPGSALRPLERTDQTLGFRTLALQLRPDSAAAGETLRILEWDLANRRLRARNGEVRAEIEMFVKNWRPGMRKAHSPASSQAVRQAGSARMATDPVLLQFDRAAIGHCEPRQRIASEASGRPTSSDLHQEIFSVTGK